MLAAAIAQSLLGAAPPGRRRAGYSGPDTREGEKTYYGYAIET